MRRSECSDTCHVWPHFRELGGNTVVKWAVCPIKNITKPEELEKLDMALGTEDDLARYYAEIAYAKWTGKENLLPGEECEEGSLPTTRACSLGIMQQDMPEPYKDEKFICPVRPLLPAKQQLEVLQNKMLGAQHRLIGFGRINSGIFFNAFLAFPFLCHQERLVSFAHEFGADEGSQLVLPWSHPATDPVRHDRESSKEGLSRNQAYGLQEFLGLN